MNWFIEHWEVLAGVVTFAGLCILAVFYLRAQNTQTVHETQTETIDALKGLLEQRTAERDDYKTRYETECSGHETTNAELAALRSEYKVVGAIVLDELLTFWSRRTAIMADLAAAKSDNEILRLTLERLQTDKAGNRI